MLIIGMLGNTKLSIWGNKLCYYSGGNKFLEISIGVRPPSSQ
jgi:hypothetical protein